MLIELILGGGGRLTVLGPLTLRMIMYFSAIPLSFLYIIIRNQMNFTEVRWLIAFVVLIAFSSSLGFFNGARIIDIFEDVKPLSFFLILPFFSLNIKSKKDIELVIKIIRIFSLVLAITYILVIILLSSQILSFNTFYSIVFHSDEVSFRNYILFFYKGFLYLCIGFFFFLPSRGLYNRIAQFILLISIILTLTRGFILMTLVVTTFYYLFIYKNKVFGLIVLIVGIIIISGALPIYLESLGNKDISNSVRYDQLSQVIQKTNIMNFIVGDGFGIGIPIRPGHMEIAFLEIFSKQGLIGLAFWLSILLFLTFKYFSLFKRKELFTQATPFFLSSIFIYFQSVTNPYINNPIGLSMILLSMIVLNKMNYLFKENSL